MYSTAIVLAAGKGLRLKSKIPKPLIKINSVPLIVYSLSVLSDHSLIRDIVVVANSKNREELGRTIRKFHINKIKEVVLGGEERQVSVRRGLDAMDRRTQMVLIHDAARPFIDEALVSAVMSAAERDGAAIVGVPVRPTIKKIATSVRRRGILAIVEKTVERKFLWEAQTPQVFKKNIILEAFKEYGNLEVTDDASLVERLGVPVSVVMGSLFNIKVTTPEDLVFAEAIAKARGGQ